MVERSLSVSTTVATSKEEVPDINPFSGATLSGENDDKVHIASFKREERELFEMAMIRAGYLKKKSTSILTGYQQKYFEVIANGAYLAYSDKKHGKNDKILCPNGVFDISLMTHIKITKPSL